jgi:hypothetical protein
MKANLVEHPGEMVQPAFLLKGTPKDIDLQIVTSVTSGSIKLGFGNTIGCVCLTTGVRKFHVKLPDRIYHSEASNWQLIQPR